MTHIKSVIAFFLTVSFSFQLAAQDSHFEKAEAYFKKRFEEVENGKAKSDNIDKAIAHYKKSDQKPEKYIGLLKSYEFKGSWTDISVEQSKAYYEKGIELGEEKIKIYPKSPGIAYWYVANYGRWGDLIDVVQAAQEGILDQTRDLANKVIDLDPTYHQAGALRLLGAIHLKAPSIPLVLTWPSNEEGKELLERAYDIAPENAANTYFYSKALIDLGHKDSAKKILDDLVSRDPRPEYLLPDIKYIEKGKELMEANY